MKIGAADRAALDLPTPQQRQGPLPISASGTRMRSADTLDRPTTGTVLRRSFRRNWNRFTNPSIRERRGKRLIRRQARSSAPCLKRPLPRAMGPNGCVIFAGALYTASHCSLGRRLCDGHAGPGLNGLDSDCVICLPLFAGRYETMPQPMVGNARCGSVPSCSRIVSAVPQSSALTN
jgi:hypothetical protein